MIESVQPEATHPPHKIEFAGEEDRQARSSQDGELDGNDTAAKIISRLIAQVRRAAGHLALRETRLATVRHGPQMRRAALDVAVALGIVLAFLTASALASWAAVGALAGPLPGWAAPLLLAAAWIGIGISLLVFARNRGDRVLGWRRTRKRGADVEQGRWENGPAPLLRRRLCRLQAV